MPASRAASMTFPYRPALDGVRGFAVFAVLLYHGDQPWARGGYLGVDVFFVLSGFLITSLLVTEWNRRGTIALRAFWARRARRLLPALGLLIVGVAGYALFVARATELSRIRGDGLATLGYVANWRFVVSGQSYFDQFAQPSPFRHMWSLAIEEQFYLVWPLVVIGLLSWRRSVRVLLWFSLAAALASAATMALLFRVGADPSRVYYGTDTRAQGMLLGAAAGIALLGRRQLVTRRARALVETVGWCALLALVVACWRASETSAFMYRGGFLLVSVAVVAVIAAASEPEPGPLGRLLSLRPLRAIGAISYGLYLWHWPVYLTLTSGRVGVDGTRLLALRLLVTAAIATASYFAVEMPIRTGQGLRPRTRTFATVACAGVLVVVLLGATTGATTPFTATPTPAQTDAPAPAAGSPKVLVQGDSVAAFLGDAMVHDKEHSGLTVWNRARWGCALGFGTTPRVGPSQGIATCPDWHQVFAREVREFDPDVVVLLSGVFEIFDRTVDGRTMKFGSEAFDRYYLHLLDDAARVLSARGAHVVLVQSPHPLRSESFWETNAEWSPDQRWRTDHYNSLLRKTAAEHPAKVSTIDLASFVCPTDPCSETVDGVVMRGDGVHWTDEGGNRVAAWLDPQLRARADAAKR